MPLAEDTRSMADLVSRVFTEVTPARVNPILDQINQIAEARGFQVYYRRRKIIVLCARPRRIPIFVQHIADIILTVNGNEVIDIVKDREGNLGYLAAEDLATRLQKLKKPKVEKPEPKPEPKKDRLTIYDRIAGEDWI